VLLNTNRRQLVVRSERARRGRPSFTLLGVWDHQAAPQGKHSRCEQQQHLQGHAFKQATSVPPEGLSSIVNRPISPNRSYPTAHSNRERSPVAHPWDAFGSCACLLSAAAKPSARPAAAAAAAKRALRRSMTLVPECQRRPWRLAHQRPRCATRMTRRRRRRRRRRLPRPCHLRLLQRQRSRLTRST
jgi:hypothetical protein